MRRLLVTAAFSALVGARAIAQSPQLAVTPDVASPGGVVTATITGPPGHQFALLGSTVGAGFSYGGVALSVGPDVVILAIGTLDGGGVAQRQFAPPFFGTVVDRYYVQAAISVAVNFVPLQLSPGRIIKNGDLVAGLTGPQGPAGPTGPPGPQGPPGLTTGLAAGSVVAPSVSFAGDSGTGLFSPGPGRIGMSVSGNPGTFFLHNSGLNNAALGAGALASVVNGDHNTAVGYRALLHNASGNGNTATGASALQNNQGTYNTAAGYFSLYVNTTGGQNTAVGAGALNVNSTGSLNTAAGASSLAANSSGGSNTGIGYRALNTTQAGSNNTAIGVDSLFALASGSANIAVGFNAGNQLAAGSNNIYIGHVGASSEGSTIRLGTSGTHTRAYAAGISTAGLTSGSMVLVGADGQLGVGPATPPVAANSPCTTGQVAWDPGFVYLCVATNSWRRAALSAW